MKVSRFSSQKGREIIKEIVSIALTGESVGVIVNTDEERLNFVDEMFWMIPQLRISIGLKKDVKLGQEYDHWYDFTAKQMD